MQRVFFTFVDITIIIQILSIFKNLYSIYFLNSSKILKNDLNKLGSNI